MSSSPTTNDSDITHICNVINVSFKYLGWWRLSWNKDTEKRKIVVQWITVHTSSYIEECRL